MVDNLPETKKVHSTRLGRFLVIHAHGALPAAVLAPGPDELGLIGLIGTLDDLYGPVPVAVGARELVLALYQRHDGEALPGTRA